MSQGFQQAPLPYFLAMSLAAVGVLWSALATILWLGARAAREMFRQQLQREREIAQRLEKEAERSREEADRARREQIAGLVKLTMAAEGLVRIRDELETKKAKRGSP